MRIRLRSVIINYKTQEFSEFIRLPAYAKNSWLEVILTDIKNLTKNQTFLLDNPENEYPATQGYICGSITITSNYIGY